jgi:hypothetical protein
MSTSPRPNLRSAPSPEELARRQQEALAKIEGAVSAKDRLAALDAWTETPNQIPAAVPLMIEREPRREPLVRTEPPPVLPTPVGASAPSVVPAPVPAPVAPLMPWDTVDADATHAYHVMLPKRLHAKIDFVWKRKNMKSFREFVMLALEKEADVALRELGEKP